MISQEKPLSDQWNWASFSAFMALFLVLPAYTFVELGLVRQASVPDIYLLMPVVYCTQSFCIFRLASRPVATKNWLLLILSHVLAIGALILLASHLRHYILIRVGALLFRFCFVAAIAIPVFGTLLFAETLRRGSLRWRRWVPSVLGFCFAVAVVGFGTEAGVRLLHDFAEADLLLPNLLPATPEQPKLIAAIGGSTMKGFPYAPYYGIGEVAEWRLRERAGQEFKFVNLAVTGASLSMAATELKHLDRQPHVLIVYSGHNEFFHELYELGLARKTSLGRIDEILNRSATFRLLNKYWQQVQVGSSDPDVYGKLIGPQLCPQSTHSIRLTRYTTRLRRLFEWAAAGRTRVVFCSPAADEADFSPNKTSCAGCSITDEIRLGKDWQQVRNYQDVEEFELAVEICNTVLNQFPDVAEFHFRAGQCYRSLGQSNIARIHFQRALESDQFPIRTLESYRQAGLQIASEFGAVTINTAEFLRQNSGDGLLGRELFLDGVHLNLRGSYLLGNEIAQRLLSAGLVKSSSENLLSGGFVESLRQLGVTAETLADAYQTTSRVLERYSNLRAFDYAERSQYGESFLEKAEQLRSGEITPGQGGTESLTSDR